MIEIDVFDIDQENRSKIYLDDILHVSYLYHKIDLNF